MIRAAAWLGCALLVLGCTDDDDNGDGDGGTPSDLLDVVAEPFRQAVGGDAPLAPVVEAGCRAVDAPRSPDSGHFVEYLHALFAGDPAEPAPGIPQAEVDAAFGDACAEFDGDVGAFVEDIADALDLDAAGFAEYVTEACASFRAREATNGQEPFGELVRPMLEAAGIADDEARSAIDRYCGQD